MADWSIPMSSSTLLVIERVLKNKANYAHEVPVLMSGFTDWFLLAGPQCAYVCYKSFYC